MNNVTHILTNKMEVNRILIELVSKNKTSRKTLEETALISIWKYVTVTNDDSANTEFTGT